MAKKLKEPKVKIGDRFGKLTVVEKVNIPIKTRKRDENGKIHEIETGKTKLGWYCKCDCGGEIVLPESTLTTERSILRSCNKCPQVENPNYVSPSKTTFEEKQDWDALYEYVRTNIFGYDKSQALPSFVVTRLQGLRYGKYMTNNKSKNNANYSDKVILNTFKFCYTNIQSALRSNNFKDEQHKFNYIAKVIENNINDVYIRMKNAEKAKEEVEKIDISQTVGYINTFKKKEKKKINNRLNELW